VRTGHVDNLGNLERIGIERDLLCFNGSNVVSCAHIKYKVEHGGRAPNADLYQLIAYCTRIGLAEGHLIYAEAEDTTRRIDVIGGPITHRHALRLDQPIADVERQLRKVAAQISASPLSR
jgi:5-methylcytosine-specific restriction enzyme subunit McrC